MYQGTGELKNFQSSKSSTHELKKFQSSESSTHELKKFQSSKSSSHVTNQSMFKYNHQYRCDGSNVKCQSLSIEIKFKCDDLDHQVSITNS